MKAKKLLIFLLCFVLLVGTLAVVASAKGATTTTSYAEVKNDDGSVMTSYGKLSSTYASAETYPFAVFKYKNETLQSSEGQKTMKGAFDSAKNGNNTWTKIKNADGSNAGVNDTENTYRTLIVLRRDYTTTSSDKYDNYAQTQNEVVVDLNGYTLTQGTGTSGLFYQVTSKGSSSQGYIFDTTFTIKNGNIAVNTSPVFYGNMWNSIYGVAADKLSGKTMADKNFTWNFDNVKFSYVSGGTATNMMIGYAAPQSIASYHPSESAPYNFNYTDCTFDITNAPAGATIFNAAPGDKDNNYYIKTTVTVTGCDIVAPATKAMSINLCKVESNHNSGSSVNFVADENSDVLTLTLPAGQTLSVPTASTYVNLDGKQLYWHKAEGNSYVLTECATDAHACSCGTIYTDCVDENADNVCDLCGATKVGGTWVAAANNFAIVDADGKFSSVQYTFKAAVTAAAKINGATIVLLNDYVNTTVDASNNLKALSGEITVDLNGHTLTRAYNGAYLFDNWLDAGTTADSVKVTFKNGTLNAEKWLVCLSGNNAIANEKQVDFAFENVTFKFAANNDKTDGWVIVVHNQTYNKTITSNITITNCTVDTTDMRSSLAMDKTPVINLAVNNASGVDYVKATVTVDGLTVVGNRFVTKSLVKAHADDTVTMSNLTLVMPNGTAPTTPAAADYFVVNGEKVYFHATTVGETETTYTLTACVAVEETHNCSCGVVMSTCADNTSDHKCDVCGAVLSECVDDDKDHVCNVCGGKSDCLDENKDHVCELCDKTTPCEDNDKDHLCDTCNKVLTERVDENKDHACDICGKVTTCDDANGDGKCDVCGLYKYDLGKYGIFWNKTNYSAEDYPFFLLKYENGVYTFYEACKSFYGNQGAANGTVQKPAAMNDAIYGVLRDNNKYDIESGMYVPQKSGGSVVEAVIVARRDYDLKMGSSSTTNTERHDNMAHMQGTVTVDLNGYTLREAAGSNKSIFTITIKGWPDDADKAYTFPCTLNITNGRLEVLKYAATALGTTDAIEASKPGTNIANSAYNINYSNLTFGLAPGATTTVLAYNTGSSTNNNPGVAKANISFTDCVFDLQTNAITGAITIINGDTTGKDVDADFVINGCKILASDMSNVTVCKSSTANGSSMSVNKDLTLVMPEGATAPALTNTVTIANGVVCSFVKSVTADGNTIYTLYPSVMVDYKIKTSVTLYSNFVYNIYIPAANVQSFTVNGETVDYTTEVIDGVEYYLVKVSLPAGETLGDIALKVTLTSGKTTVDANWTLSVVNYTKAVLGGNYNDTTKTLMKDMLVYASAAHTYFENTEAVAAKLDAIKTLLGDYTANLPTGEAKKPADNTYFTDVAVYLGAVPSFRFYLAEGYTADNFTFTVGGKATDVITGEGYVEIVMYAYMMLEDVTYNVNGTDATGTYNLFSYYKFANNPEAEYYDADLVALTEALMKYSVSAKAYRDYIVNETCQHDYADGVCTKCGEEDPDKGSLSLTAPASIYSNYAGKDITPVFSKSWYNGEITWTTSNPNVFVENGKIFAKGDFASAVDVTVTATTEHHTASVVVNVSTFNGYGHNVSAEKKVQWYENNIIKEENKGGMIFVGDSYLDGYNAAPYGTSVPSFWRDFYEDYAGEKAFLMGISSSIIEDLEIVSERIVYPMQPSEIVIHIGHNDMHSYETTSEAFVARLQALVSEYHAKLPNAKIYVLSVDPKRDSADPTNNRHQSSFVKVPAVNAAMSAYAADKDWISYVDTTSIFYTKNTAGELTAVNKNMYPSGDASHPTLVAYDLIKIKIDEAKGKTLNNVININNADNHYAIGTGGKTYNVSGDFVISGRLVITQFVKSNSHLNFNFGTASGNNRPYRFLLWDSNSNGKFGVGYEKIGSYTNEIQSGKELYDATNGLVLNWTIVVKDGNAYWFVGGALQAVFENVAITNKFNIDACGIDAIVYDIDFIEKSADETAYNNYVAPYFAEDVANIEMFGQGGDVTANGKTFTDASGNALTNNYIIKGKLDIAAFGKSNPHIQFRVGSSYRFLLWDSNRDGKFGAGYTEGSASASDATEGITLYDANSGLVLDWAVVVSEGKAYWFINGKLEKVLTNPSLSSFNLGALHTDAYFYDIELYVKSENAEAFEAQRKAYFAADSFEITNYDGSASSIASTGPTYKTDLFGNTLAGSNYVISGSLTITKTSPGSNMHLQFYFTSGWRFLLWDQAGNGKFGAGYQENNTHVNDSKVGEPYDATSGTLTLDWAVVVKDGKAYWFINGELVKTFTEPKADAFSTINIGATRMLVSVYDVEIYAENGSASEYNRVISNYTFS